MNKKFYQKKNYVRIDPENRIYDNKKETYRNVNEKILTKFENIKNLHNFKGSDVLEKILNLNDFESILEKTNFSDKESKNFISALSSLVFLDIKYYDIQNIFHVIRKK